MGSLRSADRHYAQEGRADADALEQLQSSAKELALRAQLRFEEVDRRTREASERRREQMITTGRA